MADPPELDRKIQQKAKQQTKSRFAAPLSELRAYGDTIGRTVLSDAEKQIPFLKIENSLNRLKNDLERELKKENLDGKTAKKIEQIVKQITENILPPVAVWSEYLKNKAEGTIPIYPPNYKVDLFKMVAPIGKMLRNLPEDIY